MKYTCPCCGYKTFDQPVGGSYAICRVCWWEDDGVQLDDPDYEGGANPFSLRQSQKNFAKYGACDEGMRSFARPAAADEPKDETWRPLD